MAVTVTVETNSYISASDADTYFNDRLYSTAWNGANADDKARALIGAAKAIDRQFLKGRKKLTTQFLAFPRCYDQGDGTLLCETEVLQVIKDAQCEQALFLLSFTEYELSRERQHALGIVGSSIGRANEYSAQTIVQAKRKGPGLCPDAYELLKQYLAGTVGIS